MMMLAQPLRRPPAPNSGDNFKIMVRVILQPPHDRRDALLLRRQECVDEVTTAVFGKMIEIAVMKPPWPTACRIDPFRRSEEHTSELQSLMRISYAVFCLKKKQKTNIIKHKQRQQSN